MNDRYTLSAYDETGAEKELSFETSRILTDDAYLCLKVAPFRGVVTWAEVQFDEMPAAVQEQYDGNSKTGACIVAISNGKAAAA